MWWKKLRYSNNYQEDAAIISRSILDKDFIHKDKTSFYDESGEFVWADPDSDLWIEIMMLDRWIYTEANSNVKWW